MFFLILILTSKLIFYLFFIYFFIYIFVDFACHLAFSLLLQHCSSDGPEGPSGFLERLCFEMKKGYKETMLQLLLSPIHIFVSDNYQVQNAAPKCPTSAFSVFEIE